MCLASGNDRSGFESGLTMSQLKIALLQLLPGNTLMDNLQKGIEACRRAKESGADIALFPEMWSNGYDMSESEETLKGKAVSGDGEFISAFGQLSKELDMAVAITSLESHQPLPRNAVTLFDRHGSKVLDYAKVHTCDFGDERKLSAGDDFYVADLDTAIGKVKVGAMICFDREFPESARILMLKGAEIILVPNCCPMEINRLSQLRGRAYENMIGIATCNYPSGHPSGDCNGHSSAFDGIAYLPDMCNSRDTCILEAGEEEGIFIAKFDIDLLREYRRREVHGNAYRHPQKYHILTEEAINPPFIRKNYRK